MPAKILPAVVEPPKKSYGRILKSSALIGGSTAVNMLFTVARTKAMALLLGPSGVGLLGIYGSISDLVRSIAGLGINTSGVRQIAEAVGSGDAERISFTVTTLRRVALYSGTVGAVLLVLLSRRVSWLTFHDYDHAGAIAMLGSVAFFLDISDAQKALVQGMRRIADLVRMNILGALYGTVFGIVIVYFWRERGIVPCMICVAAMSIVTSWWHARKIKIDVVRVTWARAFAEASELVKLGFLVMVNGLFTLGAAYIVRLFVLRNVGLKGAGLYQAAWGLAGVCISFILDAMGTDYYPRLTAVANQKDECNRLVNEQIEVGLLMAAPVMLVGLSLAPLAITLFYSARFGGAVEILRWFSIGMFLRVLTWPMGFIILAKGERKLFFWSGVLTNSAYLTLVWIGIKMFGLTGTGIAFFVLQVLHNIAIYHVADYLTGFAWSTANRKLALVFLPLVGVVFISWYLMAPGLVAVLGAMISLPAGYYALKTLCEMVPLERLPASARSLVVLLRLSPK